MGIFPFSPDFRFFDGPPGRSRDSSKFEENFVYVYCVPYNRELLTPCAPAAIMSAILSRFSLS